MTNEQTVATSSRPGPLKRFIRFLGRFLWALVKVALVLAVIAALGFGGYLGVREASEAYLDLSADTVETAARVDLLRSDVNSLMESDTSGQRQINAFQNDITALGGRISAVEREMATDLARQAEQLAALEGQLANLMEAGAVISGNVSLLNNGIDALQTDIVGLGSDLDSLGGEVDGLESDVVGLTAQTDTFQETLADPLAATEDVETLRQALVLFRVWEFVARARLRLVEGNAGEALVDVQLAQAALAAVIEGSSEEMSAALTQVQERLDLAAAGLPDDPITAARDLESAWEALDGLLGEILGLPFVPVEETEAATGSQE